MCACTLIPTQASAQKVSITPGTPTINEDGGAQTFTVRLDEPIISSAPPGYVQINITNNDSRLTLSTTTLYFAEGEWAQVRIFTATSSNNFVRDATSTATITLSTVSNSEYYSGFIARSLVNIVDAAPTATEVQPITEYTTLENAKYYFNIPEGCSVAAEPPVVYAFSGSMPAIETTVNADTSVPGANQRLELRGIKVNGRYSVSVGCFNSNGVSNTLRVGPFTVIASAVTSTVQNVGATASSGIVEGCKDPAAKNYNQFSVNNPRLCVYDTKAVVAAQTETALQKSLQKTERAITTITTDLFQGQSGVNVSILQKFLVAENSGPDALALKNHGTTDYFGKLCKKALIEWQKAHGINPATGVFGPKSRAQVSGSVK
jgi:hypothetical protein